MNDIAFFQVDKRICNLLNDYFSSFLAEKTFPFESLIQVSILSILHNKVNGLVIVEVTKHLDYIVVTQPIVDLDFFLHLAEEVILFKQILIYDLESHLFLRKKLNSFEYFAKLAGTNID